MRTSAALIALLTLLLCACAASGGAPDDGLTGLHWGFDGEAAVPAGFDVSAGAFEVVPDGQAHSAPNVILQTAENPRPVFNVLLGYEAHTDLEVSVQLRSVSGVIDQGGGVIWRAVDGQNYYVARYNPLEDNFRVYYVKDGERVQIQSADTAPDPGGWHSMTVRMVGDHITCDLDGMRMLDVRDTTFAGQGRIGLWTKADAVTMFDDLKVMPAR